MSKIDMRFKDEYPYLLGVCSLYDIPKERIDVAYNCYTEKLNEIGNYSDDAPTCLTWFSNNKEDFSSQLRMVIINLADAKATKIKRDVVPYSRLDAAIQVSKFAEIYNYFCDRVEEVIS